MSPSVSSRWRQALHVLRRDLAVDAPVLAGAASVMTLQTLDLVPDVSRIGGRVPLGLIPALLCLMAARLVQRDHPTSGRAFWLTRPFHRAAVAGAKSIYIGLFLCVVPALFQGAWFETMDPSAPTLSMTRDSLVYLGGLVFLAAAAGAVTTSLRRFLALILVLYTLAVTLPALPVWPRPDVGVDEGIRATRAMLEHLGWIVVGAGTLWYQYTRRRRRLAIGLGSATLMLLPVLAGLSSLDWSSTPSIADQRAAPAPLDERPPSIQLTLRELEAGIGMPQFQQGRDGVSGQFSGEGPAGLSYQIARVETRLLADEGELSSDFDLNGSPNLSSTLPVPTIPGLRPARDRFATGGRAPFFFTAPLLEGPAGGLEALEEEDRIEIRFTWRLSDWREVGRLDVQPGTTVEVGSGGRLQIRTVTGTPRVVLLSMVHRWTPLSALLLSSEHANPEIRYTFALHSRRYREFMVAQQARGLRVRDRTLIGGASLREFPFTLEFQAQTVARGSRALPDDWFDDVELIVLERRPVGTHSAEFGWDIPEWPRNPGQSVRIEESGDALRK
jgi:hypothetical protein